MDQESHPIAWNESHYDNTWGECDRINEKQEFSKPPPKVPRAGHYWAGEEEWKLFYVGDWSWDSVIARSLMFRSTTRSNGSVGADKTLRPRASDGRVGRLLEDLHPLAPTNS